MINPDAFQVVTATDTVMVLATSDTLARIADAALVTLATASLGAFVLAALLFWQVRAFLRSLDGTLRRLEPSLHPVLERVRGTTEQVEYVARSLRRDVDKVRGSVDQLTERLNQASEYMEERIDEFNALLEVVQAEAEGIFLDTASTVRGVREGAKALGTSAAGDVVDEPVPVEAPDEA